MTAETKEVLLSILDEMEYWREKSYSRQPEDSAARIMQAIVADHAGFTSRKEWEAILSGPGRDRRLSRMDADEAYAILKRRKAV